MAHDSQPAGFMFLIALCFPREVEYEKKIAPEYNSAVFYFTDYNTGNQYISYYI